MVANSSGKGDDHGHDKPADESIFDEETRILPMRSSTGEPLPGKVVGQATASDPNIFNAETRILTGRSTGAIPPDDETLADGSAPVTSAPSSTVAPSAPAPGEFSFGIDDTKDDEAEEATVFLPGPGERAVAAEPSFNPAVGWIVVLEGPGRGQHRPVYYGQNSMGRGEDQRVRLNFGDARITRDSHAFLIYDDVARKYYLRDNGKANLIRLNNEPVMAPTEIKDRDIISIGETKMLFVALCGADFDWLGDDDGGADTATRA